MDHERTTTNGSVYSDRNGKHSLAFSQIDVFVCVSLSSELLDEPHFAARDISPPASSHTDRSRFNGPPPSFNERGTVWGREIENSSSFAQGNNRSELGKIE